MACSALSCLAPGFLSHLISWDFPFVLSASAILAFCCSLNIYQVCPYLRTFALATPSAWNRLPLDICQAYTFASFRCLLKCHFLGETFPDHLVCFASKSPNLILPVYLPRPFEHLCLLAGYLLHQRQNFSVSYYSLFYPQCLAQSILSIYFFD